MHSQENRIREYHSRTVCFPKTAKKQVRLALKRRIHDVPTEDRTGDKTVMAADHNEGYCFKYFIFKQTKHIFISVRKIMNELFICS